jgi:hypothetical protein
MTTLSCPVPFLDAADFPPDVGYIAGRLCSSIPLPGARRGATCCLPCPVQNYVFHSSTLHVLFANDIVNIVGLGVGAFVLLVSYLGRVSLIAVLSIPTRESHL